MKEFEFKVNDALGIHARPAGLLVKAAKELDSEISITKNGKSVSATKLMMLMGLGVKKGDTVTVRISGGDEEKSEKVMRDFFESNL
jgi:phosphocarrier protein